MLRLNSKRRNQSHTLLRTWVTRNKLLTILTLKTMDTSKAWKWMLAKRFRTLWPLQVIFQIIILPTNPLWIKNSQNKVKLPQIYLKTITFKVWFTNMKNNRVRMLASIITKVASTAVKLRFWVKILWLIREVLLRSIIIRRGAMSENRVHITRKEITMIKLINNTKTALIIPPEESLETNKATKLRKEESTVLTRMMKMDMVLQFRTHLISTLKTTGNTIIQRQTRCCLLSRIPIKILRV